MLHDIGKIGILDSILGKIDIFNEQEWKIMRMHPNPWLSFHRPQKQATCFRCFALGFRWYSLSA